MSAAGLAVDQVNNFLALEPLLVQLLRTAVEGIKPVVHVLTAADLTDVQENAQPTPAVHLIYGGYTVLEDVRTAWRLEHAWYAVVVVRHVGNQRTGAAARAAAGPLLSLVIGCMAGATLAGAAQAMELVTPPPAYYKAGVQYIPSAFSVETIFNKPQPS